jgi:hypothetical protein
MKMLNSAMVCALAALWSAGALAQTEAAPAGENPGRPAVRPPPKAKKVSPETAKAMALAAKAAEGKAPAAEAPVSLPPLSAEQIVERNVAARGGLQAWRQVQSLSMAGQMEAGRQRAPVPPRIETTRDPLRASAERRAAARLALEKPAEAAPMIKLPFRMEMARPAKQRIELDVMGDTAVQVWDGKEGWKLRPYLGRREVEPFTPGEVKAASMQQGLDGPLIDHAAKGIKVEVAGAERVLGRPAYKLKLTARDGGQRHVWVDGESFLDIRIEGPSRRLDGKERAVYTYMQEYRKIDGLTVPFVYETRVDGVRDAERIYVEKVAFNSVTEGSRYSRPQ